MPVLTQPNWDRDTTLKWSAEYRSLRTTQNPIGNGLGLTAASKKQLALRLKTVWILLPNLRRWRPIAATLKGKITPTTLAGLFCPNLATQIPSEGVQARETELPRFWRVLAERTGAFITSFVWVKETRLPFGVMTRWQGVQKASKLRYVSSLGARSSTGQSIGLRIRGLGVQIPPGAPKNVPIFKHDVVIWCWASLRGVSG
jgi:hypothetical protein